MRSREQDAGSSTGENMAMIRRVRSEPRRVLFSMLARLWILPSLGSTWVILLAGNTWADPGPWMERLARVRFEQWIGLGILTAHVLFVYLAFRYRRVEPFREEMVDPSRPG